VASVPLFTVWLIGWVVMTGGAANATFPQNAVSAATMTKIWEGRMVSSSSLG
jgi:hypothetical protein